MDLVEASRQYQLALEYDRSVRTVLKGVLSADNIRDEATFDVEKTKAVLFAEWMRTR